MDELAPEAVPRPAGRHSALRSVLAVITGIVVTSFTALGIDSLLGRAMPEAFAKERVEDVRLLLFILVYSLACAALGGYVTARLAPRAPWVHVVVFAGLSLAGGIAAAISEAGKSPLWWLILSQALLVPAIALGGYWRIRHAGS